MKSHSKQPRCDRAENPKGVARLSERDHALLTLVYEQRAIRIDQLARFFELRPNEIVRIVARLERSGFVEQAMILYADPAPWVWVTSAGSNAAKLDRRTLVPSPATLVHHAAVNEIRLQYVQKYPDARWISERMLYAECPRGSGGHRPDGIVEFDREHYAIEVELTRKTVARVIAIADELTDRYDAVHYFCTPDARRILTLAQDIRQWENLHIHDMSQKR